MAAVQKTKIRLAISLFLVILYFSGLPAQAQYGGGSGEPNDPYLIYTAEQMNAIGAEPNDWDKHFKLMADINLSAFTGTSFNIIGYYRTWQDRKPFNGVFDGNGKRISNFNYTSTERSCIGLFGYVDGFNAEIKDLGLIDPNVDAGTGIGVGSLAGHLVWGFVDTCYVEDGSVSGNGLVGGLVGSCNRTFMTDCYTGNMSISGTEDYVGGLIGWNTGTITHCYSSGCTVLGGGLGVGGLVGSNVEGTITTCYSVGNVEGTANVGGLVGQNGTEAQMGGESGGALTNCYSTGSVSGTTNVGGLVGYNNNILTHCYVTGTVSGTTNVGGLTGENEFGTITSSFWDTQTSGQITSDGGTGKTTAEMQTESTFTDAGWDFVDETANGTEDIWWILEGQDYPRLCRENKPDEAPETQQLSDFLTGAGTEDDPYLIYTAEELNTIGLFQNDWDKHFKLMADINLSAFTGTSFNIIGYYRTYQDRKPFNGVFDGNVKRISNFTYTSTDTNHIGLFGYVDGFNAEIKDLGLIETNIDAGTGDGVGSLVGSVEKGFITNCYVEGCTVSGHMVVGGLVGENGDVWAVPNCATITNCSSTGTVSGSQQVGGLVGENEWGTIINCTSSASVAGPEWGGGYVTPVGGLVGTSYGTIANCYATGDVAGNIRVGGLVGENNGTITNCYATGNVLGSMSVGGLVGINWSGTITNCYSTGSVLGHDYVGGLVGSGGGTISSFWDTQTSRQITSASGTGKTTAEMQKPNIFMDAGWDFIGQPDGPHDIWAIPIGGGYPILCWQISPPPALPRFSGGTGEPDNPYLISTADELNSIGHNPRLMRAHFKLIDDIDLSGIDFFIIGSELYPFGGVFDGYGKKISNFTYTSTEQDFVGLFRYVEVAEIKDLGLIDPNVDAGTGIAVGSLAGHLKWVLVDTCYVEGGSVSGNGWVGGLVGSYGNAFMTDCFTEDMSISGTEDYAGGLIGGNIGMIMQCYSSGCTVSGRAAIGGLVGANGGEIYDCYATDSVIRAGYQVGGLVGLQGYIYYGTIANCYATCNVFGFQYVGGLVGENEFGTITSSFWDTQTSGQTTSDGGTGKTTAEMQMVSTFTDVGWDFVGESVNGIEDIWSICEGVDYPKLTWQFVIGDFDGDAKVGFADFAIFAGSWLGTDSSFFCGDGGTDLTNDGKVNFNDLREFAENWLYSQPMVPPQKPEPPPPALPPPPGPPPKARGCFPADTPVWVNGALVQISKVVSGQMVGEPHCGLATGCLGQIETVEEHEGTFECRDIVLESGNHISVVDAHCFMLDSGQWIAAQDLISGLRLKTLSGTVGIKSVATRAAPFVGKVYNLKVTGADRYLVSEDGVIVRDY